MPKTIVFAFWPLFFHVIVVLDVLVERTVESHLLDQTLLDDAHAGSVGVSHDDGDLDISEPHAGQCQQQQLAIVEVGVVLAGARHDVIVLQVNVVKQLDPVVLVAVLELDDALHILGNAIVGLVVAGLDDVTHHAYV